MAFLLGNETCIESLQCDLIDIQETIEDIIVRNGNSVKVYSWKYPDKIASDVKVSELLERYKFGIDEVDNQVAHYSLLELIIDRLVLLVHLSSSQIDTLINSSDAKSLNKTNSQNVLSNLSAGLSVKKFWSKFTHLCTTVRQLNNQNKTLMAKQKESIPPRPLSKASVQSITKTSESTKSEVTISYESSTKSTQTLETAFVPCESCAKLQNHLKQNADLILNMCHYQNIPSYLAKYRSALSSQVIGWLNGADIERWFIEQDKDLNRISKQLEYLTKNGELLKVKLEESEANLAKFKIIEKDLRKTLKDEQETTGTVMKQYEKKLADQKTDLSIKITSIENELKNMTKIKENLQKQIEHFEEINKANEKLIAELNETNNNLASEVHLKNTDKEKLLKLEQEKMVLNTELECLKRELNEKSKELSKERCKLENSIRQEQSLQVKQENLLKSMEQISEECEKLKDQLNSIEDERESFENRHKDLFESLHLKDNEIKKYQNENKELSKNVDDLKHNINTLTNEIKKHKEKELLLMQYPDLYGPVEIQKETNIIEDMEMQIQANKHRISLLESQNQSLRQSIQKLIEKAKTSEIIPKPFEAFRPQNENNNNMVNLTRPVPLFKLENELTDTSPKIDKNHSYWIQNESLPPQVPHKYDEATNYELNTDNIYINTIDNNSINQSFADENSKRRDGYYNNNNINSDRYSTSGSGSNSAINQQINRNQSRLSCYSRNATTPVPNTAVKDMEVVIGKGHKVTSRPSSASNRSSARSAASIPKKIDKDNKYICARCFKTYSNKKDLDIHKLYCNK